MHKPFKGYLVNAMSFAGYYEGTPFLVVMAYNATKGNAIKTSYLVRKDFFEIETRNSIYIVGHWLKYTGDYDIPENVKIALEK